MSLGNIVIPLSGTLFNISLIFENSLLLYLYLVKVSGRWRWAMEVAMDWKFQLNIVFYGQEKIVQWLTKKLETVKKELEYKVSKCLK